MVSKSSPPVAASVRREPFPAIEGPATAWLAALAGVSFLAHMLVAGNYGYFRDELYYIADGHHLQAGYVDQPLLMGWLAAFLRVTVGDGLIAIHIVPALACALIVFVTGLMARELGGGRAAQVVAGAAALFTLDFMGTGSLFSMDVLDQLWWALASLVLLRLLRRDAPRLWMLVGLVIAVALLTKLTVLYFALALAVALLVTPERRYLRTPWPWLAAGIGFLGLLPYLIWNALNGWPTWDFWHHYGARSSPPGFLADQIAQMNPIALPLAIAGLVFYFRRAGARYRLLGWTFVFAYLVLTVLRTKSYFLAPAYPILFAAGAVWFERLHLRPWLAWIRPAYIALLALAGIVLAPVVMPIEPPATYARSYGTFQQVLADRFGWDSLTRTVEQVYAGLPPALRAQACVLTSNYGEAGALQLLGRPGGLPPVISVHNNYYLWGPGQCTGAVLITVGYSARDVRNARTHFGHIRLAATQRCRYCVSYEQDLPIYVLSGPAGPSLARQWHSLKSYS
jgi:4-amino-4-deoxy-L-arabinose transferase-like glycosyltransferase